MAEYGYETAFSQVNPEDILASLKELTQEEITVASGAAAVYGRGTCLGEITIGAATVTPDEGNTGDGVLTMDSTNPKLAGVKVGDYTITCITAATNGGTFQVEDPDGYVIGNVAVGDTFADQIKFSIADGAADFIVGDKIVVTIAAGSGKYALWDESAIDGSQNLKAILVNNGIDAQSADVKTVAYTRGEFLKHRLTMADGTTITKQSYNYGQIQIVEAGN